MHPNWLFGISSSNSITPISAVVTLLKASQNRSLKGPSSSCQKGPFALAASDAILEERWNIFRGEAQHGRAYSYCWWKKSCTKYQVVYPFYPIIYRVLAPSQVVQKMSSINSIANLEPNWPPSLSGLTWNIFMGHIYFSKINESFRF